MFAVTFFNGDGWHEGVVTTDADGRMLLREEPVPTALPRLDGVVTGGFTDHHVHLQLVDAGLLASSVLGRVVDLGGDPEVLREVSRHAETAIEFAGAFLTPPGGYPSDRDWAPAGSFREIVNAEDAAAAVAEMADAGATRVKVTNNSDAGPVFTDELLRTIVELAAERDIPVVVHAQGPGQAQRAARLGAHALAHAPFSELLDEDEILAQAASVTWISTLSIHDGVDYRTAVDNVRRFHAAGGTVRYGTDMGNGPTPVDLNPREIDALREAGIDGLDLLRALAPADPRDPASALFLLPGDADPLRARRLTPADLKV
ncbi:amidohydrolase family protein [Microbacterium sp. EST19A]|uniref:amidohydrolase family protein n=1 Tax=Microbacterium sp. EST19A TaxID=2862681 RepID=UPI001CC16B67|nr:amidohydrolase family protein [Microbacterium sp. EST19A]